MKQENLSFAISLVAANLLAAGFGDAAVGPMAIEGRGKNGTGLNLALGKQYKVFSSHEGDGWSVAKLTDGQAGALGWSSKTFPGYADHRLYPEFIVVDLETSSVNSTIA